MFGLPPPHAYQLGPGRPAANPTELPSAAGLDVYAKLGGVGAIQAHTTALGEWLSRQAAALAHSNGAPLLKLYGRHNASNRRALLRGGVKGAFQPSVTQDISCQA